MSLPIFKNIFNRNCPIDQAIPTTENPLELSIRPRHHTTSTGLQIRFHMIDPIPVDSRQPCSPCSSVPVMQVFPDFVRLLLFSTAPLSL
jgi:hypothetical protein